MSAYSASHALSRFRRDETGAVAMMFGLSVIPLCLIAGAALDYARGAREKTALNAALDATSLALAQDARRLTQAELETKGQAYFDAVLRAQGGTGSPKIQLKVDPATQRLSVSASVTAPTTLMQLAGVSSMQVASAATASFGTPKIEIALVLDNTGSMAASGKMDALKVAATDFIDQLQAKAQQAGDIKVAIVPFATQVRVDPARLGLIPAGSTTVDSTRAPWLDFSHITPAAWTASACISDRPYSGDYDVDAHAGALYPAAGCQFGTLSSMIGLTDVFASGSAQTLRDAVNAMTPSGNTNITIGMAWGQTALTPSNPLGTARAANDPDVRKFVVLLTDGDNTANSFGMWPNQIDDRTRLACSAAKSAAVGASVYTIRVINGNADLLRSCASAPTNYYEAANAAQIQPAFKKILDSILRIRLAS